MTPCSDDARDDLPEGRAGAPRVRVPRARRARAPTPSSCCPRAFAAREPPRLPEVSEPEIVRHYVGISKRNFDLDSGFYPLGSCTMKHNPRLHERVAALPGHARLHPLQDPERAQGALELMWNLQQRAGRDLRACRTSRCSPRRARTASSPACCSRAPTTRTAARPATRCSRPTPPTAPTPPRSRWPAGGGQARHRRRRRRRPRGPARQGRHRRGLPDAHQPQHARPVRPQHRARSPRSCTAWARRSTTTAPTSTR